MTCWSFLVKNAPPIETHGLWTKLIEIKRPSKSSNTMICSTHLVWQTFFNFFFRQSGAWFSMESFSILGHGSEKVKKKESSLIWSRTFVIPWILHDAATARFNLWLLWVCTAFLLILSMFAERQSIWSETEAAPSYPSILQLLISKVRCPTSLRTVLVKAFPDSFSSQFKEPKNHFLISPNLPTNVKAKDNFSWFKQSDALSLKLKKKYFL